MERKAIKLRLYRVSDEYVQRMKDHGKGVPYGGRACVTIEIDGREFVVDKLQSIVFNANTQSPFGEVSLTVHGHVDVKVVESPFWIQE